VYGEGNRAVANAALGPTTVPGAYSHRSVTRGQDVGTQAQQRDSEGGGLNHLWLVRTTRTGRPSPSPAASR